MIVRPLFPTVEPTPISTGVEYDVDPDCRRCGLHKGPINRCLPADGVPGGLFVVGQQAGQIEDIKRRVFVGRTSKVLREVIAEHWDGPVVYDNVTRCYPGKAASPTARQIETCRPYLRRVARLSQATRVIALGSDAVLGLLGHTVPIMSVRRGYGWATLPGAVEPVPVFFVMHPAAASRNRFLLRQFKADLEWALTTNEALRPPLRGEVRVVETVEDSREACEELRLEAPWFAYDCEWGGVPFSKFFEVTTLAAVASGTDDAFVWSRAALRDPAVRRPLEELLEDPSVGKVGHNLKADVIAVRAAWGVEVQGAAGDTRLRRRLLEADVNGRLDVCDHLVGMGGHKNEHDRELDKAIRLIERTRAAKASAQQGLFDHVEELDPALDAAVNLMPHEHPKRFAYALVDQEISDRYCARDAVATARLEDVLSHRVETNRSISWVWDQVVSKATDAVAQMEIWGLSASREQMERCDAYFALESEIVKDRLLAYDPHFNPASPQDVGRLLYDKLKLPVLSYTSTGQPSTDKVTLHKLRHKHPIVQDLHEFRRLEKLRSNYGLNLASWIQDDGRIHPDLKIDGTRTGRLSCVAPPLQTLPRGQSVEGAMIKSCFVAPPGYRIVQLDYSQIELRVAAFLSGDPLMISMFQSGEDFHTATAKLIAPIYWGIQPHEVGKEHRSYSKSCNFGLMYGMTDGGLAKQLNCTLEDAARLRAAILGKFVRLKSWMADRLVETRKTGAARTWWGGEPARLRPLIGIASQDSRQKSTAENSSKNTPIQGCLPASTRILTANGVLPIGEASDRGTVWTGTVWADYIRLNRGVCELADIVLDNGQVLRCDTRHKVLVVGKGCYEFKAWESLCEGDHVCMSLADTVEFGEDLGSAEDYYWLGFSIGNGCTSHGKSHVNCLAVTFGDRLGRYAKDTKADEFDLYLRAQGFVPQKHRVLKSKITVCCESLSLRKHWESGFGYPWGRDSHGKSVPTSVWCATSTARAKFLVGLLDADGTVGDGASSPPNLHMCNETLLREVQILARTIGVESRLRGPYQIGDHTSWRLDFNGMHLARLGYGTRKREIVRDTAPRFIVDKFVRAMVGREVDLGSDRTLLSRMRCGGSTSVYTLNKLAKKYGVDLEIFATSVVVGKQALGIYENTYTLSVDHPSHRFDSEGVISKNTASDFMLRSICDIVQWLRRDRVDAKLVLTVHDSVIFEVAEGIVVDVIEQATAIMQSHDSRGVPLKVDAEVGSSLGDLKAWEA